jgi:hypothetical protein
MSNQKYGESKEMKNGPSESSTLREHGCSRFGVATRAELNQWARTNQREGGGGGWQRECAGRCENKHACELRESEERSNDVPENDMNVGSSSSCDAPSAEAAVKFWDVVRRAAAAAASATVASGAAAWSSGIVKDVRGSESNCEHDSRNM